MTTRMTPPAGQDVGSVAYPVEGQVEWETAHPGRDGVFDIPDHAAPGLAAQGWVTVAEEEKPPVGFTKPRARKPKTDDEPTTEEADK